MFDPDFLPLDEPAAGLSNDEIARALIKAISARGVHMEVASAYLGG